MRRGERIPLHNHGNFDEGGPLASSATMVAAGTAVPAGTSTGGGNPHGDPYVEDLPTRETDITLVLSPDGAGGLVFRAETAPSTGFLTDTDGEQHQISAHGSMGATETFDLTTANTHTGTLDANCTITLTGWPSGVRGIMQVKLTENGTGGFTPTFTCSGSIVWLGGSTPAHDTTAGTVSEYIFWSDDGGTTVYGGKVGGASGAITSSALTMSTSRLLGRTTAGTGAIEEISVGTGLVLSGGSLSATGSGGGASEHAHIVSETHLSNGSTTTWTLDHYYEPGSVIAWNTTTLARLDVTEVLPDQATVSAAGTSGDKIVFDYAATLGA